MSIKEKLGLKDMTGKDTDNVEEIVNEMEDTNDIISLLALSELVNTDNPEKLKTISRIKYDQIIPLTKLDLYADTFNIPVAKKLSSNILKMLISTNGLGRKELVQLVQKRFDNLELNPQLTSKKIFR